MSEGTLNRALSREFPDWSPTTAQANTAEALAGLIGVAAWPVRTDFGPGFLFGDSPETAVLFIRIGRDGIPKEPLCAPRVWQAFERVFRRTAFGEDDS
jgi:hypothetical protein